MDVLGLINSFIRVVDLGSIAAAARSQGMSAAAVSQGLMRLEAHVGARLLSRTTRSMVPTEAGARYYEKVRHIPQDLALAAQAAAADTEPQGQLRVATTAAFGRHVLAPLMPAFRAAHPNVEVELMATDRQVDHRVEGVDLSFRIAAQLDGRLVARRVVSRPFVVCASPDYLARAGVPTSPEDLQNHDCLLLRYPTDGRLLPWTFVRGGRRFEPALTPAFVCDDVDMLAQIAANGGGIARLGSFVAQPWIDSGRLLVLFEKGRQQTAHAELEPIEIYACVAERSGLNSKVRALIGFVERSLNEGDATRT